MKLTLALTLLLGGLLIGCQSHTPSAAPHSAAPPASVADYPPGSLGLRLHGDGAPITSFETDGAAATA
jgi:hypothetical protein